MPDEIVVLIQEPFLLIAILMAGAVIGALAEQWRVRANRKAWRTANPRPWRGNGSERRHDTQSSPTPSANAAPFDAAEQLRIVLGARFTPQPLLNRSEARLFSELDRMVLAINPDWQVMAQVSLGEILRSTDPKAYSCINSKRVDLLLVDQDCQPRHVVEYQGGGHHQGNAAARDAVKKEALRRAGITYQEVLAGQTTRAELRMLISRLVEPKAPAPALPEPATIAAGAIPAPLDRPQAAQ